jgi:hypothetical protein
MSSWTIVLCEGAQDQAAISGLLEVCANWLRIRSDSDLAGLPDRPLPKLFPKPKESGQWKHRFDVDLAPAFLRKNDSWIVIREFGGVERVLGNIALEFLDELNPERLAVIVDADDVGPDARRESFRTRFGAKYEHASNANPGVVVHGKPILGLWVAPDNLVEGNLNQLIIECTSRHREKTIQLGKDFVDELAASEPSEQVKQKHKAVLGAVGQVVAPGASLASALERKRNFWFDNDANNVEGVSALVRFIETISLPQGP